MAISTTTQETQPPPGDPAGPAREPLWTVPNILCGIRLISSPILPVLAWINLAEWCLGLFLVLLLTDWLDGKLARLLKQETLFGTQLDSYADVTFYSCVMVALAVLRGDLIQDEAIGIGLGVASYAASVAAGWIKFRRVPSYHTRMAKTSWFLVGIAVVSVFAGWSIWFFRLALGAVFLTNLEAIAITFVLPRWRVNVVWLIHALRLRREERRVGESSRSFPALPSRGECDRGEQA